MNTAIRVTIPAGAAVSEAVNAQSYFSGTAGLVNIPPAWTAANLGFLVSDAIDGDFTPLRDEAGNLVQVSGIQTAAKTWYALPAAVNGALAMKLWSCTDAGVNTNQAADRQITLAIKG